ncbi:unnamed protein product [Arctogadus glacialis]
MKDKIRKDEDDKRSVYSEENEKNASTKEKEEKKQEKRQGPGFVWDQATSLDIEALKVIRRHAHPPRGRETHQAASVGGRGGPLEAVVADRPGCVDACAA